MDEAENLLSVGSRRNASSKLSCCIAGGFLLFWIVLFFAVVIPFMYRLPTALTMEDSGNNVFIAERAYKNLYNLSNIGVKLTGTDENEFGAVNFILDELAKIKEDLQDDIFDIEIDHSHTSGTFITKSHLRHLLRVYRGLQNIVVKLSPKNSTSETYLLVNSHFDSASGPGAGDAGSMIVTMLEVLRVIATSNQPIQHPIVFLFNGAEEGGLLASHGFITQHKWASFCKVVINLDAAGTGSRDILFQTGPNHSWLAAYYKKYVKHPFATTMAEEIFQAGIIPSDTDFRQFKTYGKIPGLDMAQCFNGFVYHTKYDTIDVIPRESLQNTGDNILGLVRGLANATELHNTEAHKSGNAVFFDFLGLLFFYYSEATGVLLNFGVAGATLTLVFISMSRMATVSQVSMCYVILRFIWALIRQILSLVLAIVLPIVITNFMDSHGHSLTYYSNPMLIVGLYVSPSLIGLTLSITLQCRLQRNDKISASYSNQLALHSQAVILAVVAITLTAMGIRSAYIFVIPLIFYCIALALNLITILHDLGFAFTGILKISQIIPFLYSSYLFYCFIVVMTPMGGRSGSDSNQDIYIAVLSAVGTILAFGFLIPLINTFRRPSLVILTLLATTALTLFLATSTHIGFPYRPKTNAQRVTYLEARNMFYEYDGTLSKDESGYLILFQDRRRDKPLLDANVNLTGLVSLKSNCEKHMMCGMPMSDSRCIGSESRCAWLPRSVPVVLPGSTTLELQNKTILNATTVRFEFTLRGPISMTLSIQPYEDVRISNWSFLRSYLEDPPLAPIPYLINFKYATDDSPFEFFVEFLKSNGNFNVPVCQLGVAGHHLANVGDTEGIKFASSFPSYSFPDYWPASYKRYIF